MGTNDMVSSEWPGEDTLRKCTAIILSNGDTSELPEGMLKDVAIIGDLKSLKILSFSSSEIEKLPAEIGDKWDWSREYKTPRMLKFKLNTGIFLEDGFISQFNGIEYLFLDRLKKVLQNKQKLLTDEIRSNEVVLEDELDTPMALLDGKAVFSNLEDIIISHMDNLEMIWQDQLADNSFCKLKAMTVKHCNNLPTIFPFYMCGRWSSLEYLSVIDCGSLQEIYELQWLTCEETHDTTVNQLINLHIRCLPKLKYVWNKDPKGILSFQNLCAVRVSACQSLKNLFPASIAISLLQLEELDMYNCGVEEIVSKEGEAKAVARFVFPRMTVMPFKT
ncbi:hypothetical protein EZV62_006979 [Acer yangbiense]|uniref:Disease resistance protein At4g27190-like leucine-rich repeats domain-containing protein n=1 Tax=Acer yangbiense TaxID=1000413 RepID=A0A5C7I977_9ROSI|nr:hypothetical protein EZV62_006979 [Acer yangbiense]